MGYFLISFIAFLSFTLIIPNLVQAQISVGLEASVGRYYFSASGIVSPYASVNMTSQDFYLSSTLADRTGRFFLPKTLVNDAFNNFCLEVIDVKKVGTSYTCFDIEPPVRDYGKDEIFLPPTVGLSGTKIKPNSSITVSGYSMPGSSIEINVGEKFRTKTIADENGFYNLELKPDLASGKYELYATSVYEAKESEKPTRTFTIEILSLFQMIPVWMIGLSIFILILILLFILFIILRKRRRKNNNKQKK